mmetsp:Transcript_18724/g.41677  ORF Transcript_18724/g.41677 Transcript_18724/m.41677 type:complete len:351 (-) Transcript_18724:72-1124(-)
MRSRSWRPVSARVASDLARPEVSLAWPARPSSSPSVMLTSIRASSSAVTRLCTPTWSASMRCSIFNSVICPFCIIRSLSSWFLVWSRASCICWFLLRSTSISSLRMKTVFSVLSRMSVMSDAYPSTVSLIAFMPESLRLLEAVRSSMISTSSSDTRSLRELITSPLMTDSELFTCCSTSLTAFITVCSSDVVGRICSSLCRRSSCRLKPEILDSSVISAVLNLFSTSLRTFCISRISLASSVTLRGRSATTGHETGAAGSGDNPASAIESGASSGTGSTLKDPRLDVEEGDLASKAFPFCSKCAILSSIAKAHAGALSGLVFSESLYSRSRMVFSRAFASTRTMASTLSW